MRLPGSAADADRVERRILPEPAEPRAARGRGALAAAIMGTLVKGMGQKQYGYKPLGAADGPIKTAILGENVAKLYNFTRTAELGGRTDRLAAIKQQYEANGGERSNLRYGYVLKKA